MKIFELSIDGQGETDPQVVNESLLLEIFEGQNECLAIDYNIKLVDRLLQDLRPKITSKLRYGSDKKCLKISYMAGFSLFIVSGESAEKVVSRYKKLVIADFRVESIYDASEIPVDDDVVTDAMGIANLLSFSKSLILFAHDGCPVFVWDLSRR